MELPIIRWILCSVFLVAALTSVKCQASIHDPNYYGVVLNGSSPGQIKYHQDGEQFNLTQNSLCQIYGPFVVEKLMDGKVIEKIRTTGHLSEGNYRLRKTEESFVAIAYSDTHYKGRVIYLKSNNAYHSLMPEGIKSMKSLVRFKCRSNSDGAVKDLWPLEFCEGEYGNIKFESTLRDVLILENTCP